MVYGPTGPIGFAFVYGLTGAVRWFDQFFIVRSQRRAHLGKAAAKRPSTFIQDDGQSPSETRTRSQRGSGVASSRRSAAMSKSGYSRCPTSRTSRTTSFSPLTSPRDQASFRNTRGSPSAGGAL